jgi:hypothetical protein
MKIRILLLALLVLLGSAAQAQDKMDVNVVINNKALPAKPPPLKVAGQVMLPLRSVFNAMGATVRYEDKIITATRGKKEVVMSPNVNQALIDGHEITMKVPPMVFQGATYVPLRFVAQALGDTVSFDKKTNTIIVGPGEDPIDVAPDRLSILKVRLKQLVIGNQGAILKVRNKAGSKEVYYRGLDDRDTAPYSGEDQTKILTATELQSDLRNWSGDAMEGFSALPKRETVAFLGLVYSIPASSPHDPGKAIDDEIELFLIKVVGTHKSVVVRRQAVLSMAVGESVDPAVLEAVLRLYETSENLWETFPVQQYFEYHADELRTRPDLSRVRARVAAVNSLYTANILGYLDGK